MKLLTLRFLVLLLLAGCAAQPQVETRTLSRLSSANAIEASAPPSVIFIPIKPVVAPFGADLYSAFDPSGPWIYRTDITATTNANGEVIWLVPRTPGATQEFYRIEPD